jgi:hypothetical protein
VKLKITGSYSDDVVNVKVFIFRNVRQFSLVGKYIYVEGIFRLYL